MIDTLLKNVPRLGPPASWPSLKLEPQRYFVITLHRQLNVDGEQQLLRLPQVIAEGTQGLPVIFPVHPRTAKNLQARGAQNLPPLRACWPGSGRRSEPAALRR